MQEVDAERRIKILRGEEPSPPPPPPSPPSVAPHEKVRADETGRYKKRRRIAGENDTDRDIRWAQEDVTEALARREKQNVSRSSDAPLIDSAGHVNLFPSESAEKKPVEKNKEAEKDAADKKRQYEDQYTMRFSNAAGFRQSVGQKPWYSSSRNDVMAPEPIPGKDVWGNEDPMRWERDAARMNANDPLAAMKRGVRQLKSVELERKKWNEEKSRELEALEAEERRQSRHRRRRRSVAESESGDSLEGFKLDASHDDREDRHRRRSSHRHHRHNRERSRDRSHRKDSYSHSRRHHRDKYPSRHERRRHSRKDESETRQRAVR